MPRRSTKFYRKNENEVMKQLGLTPTRNSGAGWLEKEDGQSEYIICQLKSTDANSISIKKKDLDTLLYNAIVSHKLPLFAIQFIQSDEIYLLLKPSDLKAICEAMEGNRETDAGEEWDKFDVDKMAEKVYTEKADTRADSATVRQTIRKRREQEAEKRIEEMKQRQREIMKERRKRAKQWKRNSNNED